MFLGYKFKLRLIKLALLLNLVLAAEKSRRNWLSRAAACTVVLHGNLDGLSLLVCRGDRREFEMLD